MSFGSTPVSTTPLGSNQFPVSAVAEPGLAGGNLTALEGGPGTIDANGNRTAPVSLWIKDGGSVTTGAQADAAATDATLSRSMMAFLKGVVKVLSDVWDSVNHRLFVADIEPSGYVALSSPPAQTNAGSETVLTFSSQVNRVEIYNGSPSALNYAFDTTCTAGSLVLPPNYQMEKPKKMTTVHLLTASAININGTAAGNIVVLGSL